MALNRHPLLIDDLRFFTRPLRANLEPGTRNLEPREAVIRNPRNGNPLRGNASMKITRFEDLEIWQEARNLCSFIFRLTAKETFAKDYRFRDQIRSSAGSIMDNIAEGFERDGNKEFVQFLSIAKGSCGETRSQSYRAYDYGYITENDLEELMARTTSLSKKMAGFIGYLKKSTYKGQKFTKP